MSLTAGEGRPVQPQIYSGIYAHRLRNGASVRLTLDKWEDGVPFWIERHRQ